MCLEHKISELQKMLKKKEELLGMTEGSKVVILTVDPKKESIALQKLKKLLPKNTSYLDVSEFVIQAVEEYGIENLRSDKEFYGRSYMEGIKERISDLVISTIRKKTSKGICVIHRLGILNGIVRLTPIIESITGTLIFPMIAMYPGRKKDNTLYFLGERHITSIYRAEII